jgi:DNA-binding NarL/FixJ family response regulator
VTKRVSSRRVRKIPRKGRATVCLYWFHPLLLAEFQRLLPPGDFHLTSRQLEPDAMPDLRSVSHPRASLYVAELHPRGPVTETLVAAVAERSPGARVLVVAEKFHESNAFPLLRLGVKGLLEYSELPSQLGRAAGVVTGGGFWVPRVLLSAFLDTMRGAPLPGRTMAGAGHLTEREREVQDCLLQNLLNKEIAKKLHISERTAKFHVSNLLAKFGVQRRADLILLTYAQRERLT